MRRADRIPLKYRLRLLGTPPVSARHAEWSVISSTDDITPEPTDELLGLVLAIAQRARAHRLDAAAARCRTAVESHWMNHWPGDHYRLLAALGEVLGASAAVEVGTYTGMATLALATVVKRVVTYDIVPWDSLTGTALRPSDFHGGIEQRLGNLADPAYFASQRDELAAADILFVDGPKDGAFEPAFIAQLTPWLRAGQVLIFDDIRKLELVQLWRDLPLSKLDITSLGHWSGTGIAIA